MFWRLWIVPLILLGGSGIYPALFPLLESSIPWCQTPVSGVCEKQRSLHSKEALLTGREKSKHRISKYPNFANNPLMTRRMRRQMAPYLLPLKSPLKTLCDEIFSDSHVIDTERSLEEAGFQILFEQKRSLIIVAKHPKVDGYLFKIYLTSKKVRKDKMVGWELLTTRCIVAQKIKSIIKKKKIRNFMVADKWLYPLPPPEMQQHEHVEPVILVVKDMKIYNRARSRDVWELNVERKHLRELYTIFKKGYGSAYLHANVPFTESGKFAFIDTEYNKRKINLAHARRFLSDEMQIYWEHLTGLPPDPEIDPSLRP